MFSPPAQKLVEDHYRTDLQTALGLPMRMTGPASIKPLYAPPLQYGDTITDEFGVVWSTSEIDRGQPIESCLSEPSLAGYKFPDSEAAYRFADLADWCAAQRDGFRVIWVGDLWERATFMRGMTELLMDLMLHPTFVAELLERLGEHILRTMNILLERFEFDCIAVSDDYGTQKSMLMSPDQWRRFVRPVLARVYARAQDNGLYVFHHTCGHVTPIIPDLIDIGLDILHPIQPETMDVVDLKQRFGNNLTFCGGLNTQQLLCTGTPDDVREEVRRLKRLLGDTGGYILEPGITIQADVPLPNMLAMIEEARGSHWQSRIGT